MSDTENDMSSRRTSITAVASSLCVGLAAGAATPPAEAPEAGIDIQVPDSKDRIEQYWTRDRMKAAKPMPKPVIPGGPRSLAPEPVEEE
jgi:hypothetical protein